MAEPDYFDREYFRLHDGKVRYLEYLVSLLRRHGIDGGPVLDLGSGYGFFLDALVNHGYSAAGLELSFHACRRSRALTPAWVTAGDAEAPIPFRAGAFAAVTILDVVEHLDRYRETLVECRRVLRPGGKLFMTTLNRFSVARPLLGKRWSWYQDPTHVHMFSGRRLRNDLVVAGFRTVTSTTIFNFCSVGESTPGLTPLRRIGRVVRVPAFGDAVLVIGTVDRGPRPDPPQAARSTRPR